jgi:hypothetical protein
MSAELSLLSGVQSLPSVIFHDSEAALTQIGVINLA